MSESHATEGSVLANHNLGVARALQLMLAFAHVATYEEARRACITGPGEGCVSDATIAPWFSRLSDRVANALPSIAGGASGSRIGGLRQVVQVDEALIDQRKYNRGRVLPGS